MSPDCDVPPAPPPAQIVTVELYNQKRTVQTFESMPDYLRYAERTVKCNGKYERISIPVAKIIHDARDRDGRSVSMDDAFRIDIISLDQDGKVLQVATQMRKPDFDEQDPVAPKAGKKQPKIQK